MIGMRVCKQHCIQALQPDSERLLAQMQSADFSLDGLLSDVRKFVNGTGLRDDATAILVGARPEPALAPDSFRAQT
jgi:hypothetical protein